MTQGPKKPNSPNAPNLPTKQERKEPAFTPANTSNSQQTKGITNTIISEIDKLGSLKEYPIRLLVEHAKNLGEYLKNQRLETNQVRKFLDAINQIKNTLTEDNDFSKIETSVVLLKPKLVYAAARQPAAKPLSDVMSAAIDKVKSTPDFERLVQLIESIIAYHKAAGGK